MKRCSMCRKRKQFTAFYKNRKRKDGLGNRCKVCMAAYGKKWYRDNASRHKAQTSAHKKTHREVLSMWLLWYLLENPCVDCGEGDPIVLEFDHVRGVKRFNISRMRTQGFSLSLVVKEVAKCDIRCANCHARVTAHRRGTDRKQNASITQ